MANSLERLTSPQYRIAYREGKRYAGELVVAYVRRNGLAWTRVGVAVSKRFGGAVRRNRVKRRVREACWRHRDLLAGGVDVILVPRVRVSTAPFTDVEVSVRRVFVEAGLLAERPGNQ